MKKKLIYLSLITITSILFLLLWNLNYDIIEYVMKKRSIKLLAIILSGVSIGSATLVFQGITSNRILTPSILGLDSLYLLFQLLIVVLFGSFSVFQSNEYLNFTLSAILMIVFSVLLYKHILSKQKSIYLVILVGVIMGTFFTSINGMLQIIISPDEYSMVIDRMFASFNDVKAGLLIPSILLIVISLAVIIHKRFILDVISLGKDHAVNLGVNYDKEVQNLLIIVFVLISMSTALVGPITFLGFFSVNITKTIFKTNKNSYLLIGTSLFAVSTLCVGQLLVEHVLRFGVPISVLISMFGGGYFIKLILKENES